MHRRVGNQNGVMRWWRWVRRVEIACLSVLLGGWDVVDRVDMIEN